MSQGYSKMARTSAEGEVIINHNQNLIRFEKKKKNRIMKKIWKTIRTVIQAETQF